MPLLAFTATVLQGASRLPAWGTSGNPCPGHRQIGGCASASGEPLAGLPEWPYVCLGSGWSSHQPCTFPHMFPPRGTFSLFPQFFGHWPHTRPSDCFMSILPKGLWDKGRRPKHLLLSPRSLNLHISSQLSAAGFQACLFHFQEKHSINCGSGTKVPGFSSNSISHCCWCDLGNHLTSLNLSFILCKWG